MFEELNMNDEDWKLELDNGDEINIKGCIVTIQSIEHFEAKGHKTVRIVTKDGEVIECFLSEIS